MSGALETAASAFAVVGVADVVIRTGRELYRFLCDVSGAPDDVQRLNECIRDTVGLVDALRKCTQTNVDADIVASVQTAVKALERELQSIKIGLARFKGAKTAWSRIKYALDDRKVAKALANLERSKSLLVNSLTIIYGESSASNFHQISTLVTQVSTKADTLAQTMTTSLDTYQNTIKGKLDTHGQQSLERQDAHQQALRSQLDAHHHLHQQGISKVLIDQANLSFRQERLIQNSTQTEKRTASLEKKVQRASRVSMKDHQRTRSLLKDEFERLQTALKESPACPKKSGNEVYFRGERPDMIMAYLLPIKDELNTVLDQSLTQSHHKMPIQELFSLREEFQRLVGSAAQEEAARYSMSTATSFDDWFFPGQNSKSGTSSVKRQNGPAQNLGEMVLSDSSAQEPRHRTRQAKRKTQTLSFETKTGTLRLHISQKESRGYNTQSSCDLGLSFTNRAQSFTTIDIQFVRTFLHQMCPRVHAHLNVFTRCSESNYSAYFEFIKSDFTIEDVDTAIRLGSISPYHIHPNGENFILSSAAEFGRLDILQYLESHGIGISGLRQDRSLYRGLKRTFRQWNGTGYLGDNAMATTRYIRHLVYDSSVILADLILIFISDYYGICDVSTEQLAVLDGYLRDMCNEGYDCAIYRPRDSSNMYEFRWDRPTLCDLILLLVEAGANIHEQPRGLAYIPELTTEYFIYSYERMPGIFEDLLYAFVQAGADIHALNDEQRTPSMTARYFDFWPLWCQTLEDSGKKIEEVLRAEGNEWLLADDWEDILTAQTEGRDTDYDSEDYTESDSNVDTSDEVSQNASGDEDNIDTE